MKEQEEEEEEEEVIAVGWDSSVLKEESPLLPPSLERADLWKTVRFFISQFRDEFYIVLSSTK